MIHARWVEGKTIAKVQTQSFTAKETGHGGCQELQRIIFTDGSELRFTALETETEPLCEALYVKARKEKANHG